MDKKTLLSCIVDMLRQEVENLTRAAKTAHADATDPESKAENKYDTRGLEASYLAGAQAEMAAASLHSISCYNALELQDFSGNLPIALTAFIELGSEDGTRSFYFMGPKSGGTEIAYDGMNVLLITPSSPLGGKLLGRKTGDCIEMRSGDRVKEYEIIAVY